VTSFLRELILRDAISCKIHSTAYKVSW